jgi:Protein of unknown function (DUF732)
MALKMRQIAAHPQIWTAATLVPLIAALTFAAPAHADEQGYIDYLNSHGVPTPFRSAALGEGYRLCAQIGAGMSPDDAINQSLGFQRLWSPATVYAAQHELCPNTLQPAPPGPPAPPPPPPPPQ